jgi:Sigma-70, region 4
MDRERAEAFLRLLAEAELRRVTARPRDSAPPDVPGAEREAAAALLRRPAVAAMLGDLPDREREAITLQYHAGLSEAETAATMRISRGAVRAHTDRGMTMLRAAPQRSSYARADRVAVALTGVGALDEQVADQVLDDFQWALAVRQAGSGRQRQHRLINLMAGARRRPAGTAAWRTRPPAGPPSAAGRVVPLGQRIAFRGADVIGEVYLLSYTRVASGPQLSVFAQTRGRSGLWEPAGPRVFDPFTATDDQGTSYQVTIRDIGSPVLGWTLMLRPDPPHDPRWLDLATTPGGPAVRIDLDRRAAGSHPPDAADVTARKTALSPAEYLLHSMAARLLAAVSPLPRDPWLYGTGHRPRALPGSTGELGDVTAALQACGAVSPLSPVPGQLAVLCAGLNADGPGITAPPACDLPEQWLGLLAWYRWSQTRTAAERDGCAVAAAVLPELDGIRIAVLGLHNSQDSTVVHMHASGPDADAIYGPDELYAWAVVWIRDSGGRWHATGTLGRSGMNGEVALRVQVVPPLSQGTAWIELLATGQSAEIRATVPLHWE